MKLSRCYSILVVAGLLALSAQSARSDVVIKSGDPAPGLGGGAVIGAVIDGPPVINAHGALAFISRIGGAGIDPGTRAIWAGTPDNLQLVFRQFDPAPGIGGGAQMRFFGPPSMNSAGDVAFFGGFGSGSDRGIWLGRPGALQLVVRSGDPAPGLPAGMTFTRLNSPDINESGLLAFSAVAVDQGPPARRVEGIWVGTPGALNLTVRTGEPAPGIAGANFDRLRDPKINDSGVLAFRAETFGPGLQDFDEGIWAGTGGSLQLAVQVGQQAPTLPAGWVMDVLEDPSIDNGGLVAFQGEMVRSTLRRVGIWHGRPNDMRRVLFTGNDAPGFPGHTFREIANPALSKSGWLSFYGTVLPSGTQGLWAGRAPYLRLIARQGDRIRVGPGDEREILIIGFDSDLNESGEVAFKAIIRGISSHPEAIVRVNLLAKDEVIADFGPGLGLWRRGDDGVWRRLNGASPQVLATGRFESRILDGVISGFGPSLGLWSWRQNGGWEKLHGASPEAVAAGDLDADWDTRDDLVLDFGAGLGLWARMSDGAWVKLHGISPKSIATVELFDFEGDFLVADFGAGQGLWRWDPFNHWRKLHGATAAAFTSGDLDGDGRAEIIVDFGAQAAPAPSGLWAFIGGRWQRLHGASPSVMAVGRSARNRQGTLFAGFAGLGLWTWNQGTWRRLHRLVPQTLTATDLDENGIADMVAGFPGLGLWAWVNGTRWQKLHGGVPNLVVSGNLDGD